MAKKISAPRDAGMNGFGRFGLNLLKSWIDDPEAPYAIRFLNDEKLTAPKILDIIQKDPLVDFRSYAVSLDGDILRVSTPEGRSAHITITTGPADQAPWLGIPQLFFECSGARQEAERCKPFLTGNTKVVMISATSYDADATILAGFNHAAFDPKRHRIISYGSCTVNGYVPLAAFLHKKFGVESSAVNVVHNIQLYRLPTFHTLQRKFCTLEKMGPEFLPFLRKDNFIVNYTVVPYEGVSVIDFAFRFPRRVTREKLIATIKKAIGPKGELEGLYGMIEKDTGPEAHVRTEFSAVLIEDAVQMRGNTAHLFAYFYNEGTARYHQLATYIAGKL